VSPNDATIVVVPRDHFSDTKESLESIYAFTPPGVPLVYVDGNAPSPIASYLRDQARERGFRLLRHDYYLTPNQARNIGAAEVSTRYIVFVDNDVVVAPDWFPRLVECADSTGAAVVGPLNFEKRPLHQIVHFAGGDARIDATSLDGTPRRHLVDRIHKVPVPEQPQVTEVAEFHCMLVRTDVFRALGGLDERMLSTRENIDFCLAVQEAGGSIYLEPRSRITYLPPHPIKLADCAYFALRWSDLWDKASFEHLRDKWRLDEDEYFERQYRNLGWRRREMMMRETLLAWLVSWRVRSVAERVLRPLERRVNASIARRHAARHRIPLTSAR
jgi:GT2 family glycosyltransferase